jgi:hypothetical protein
MPPKRLPARKPKRSSAPARASSKRGKRASLRRPRASPGKRGGTDTGVPHVWFGPYPNALAPAPNTWMDWDGRYPPPAGYSSFGGRGR